MNSLAVQSSGTISTFSEGLLSFLGFWVFLFSNILWATWGSHDKAYALIVLQLSLASLNIRGAIKNRSS